LSKSDGSGTIQSGIDGKLVSFLSENTDPVIDVVATLTLFIDISVVAAPEVLPQAYPAFTPRRKAAVFVWGGT
jgi:hypothetical protein